MDTIKNNSLGSDSAEVFNRRQAIAKTSDHWRTCVVPGPPWIRGIQWYYKNVYTCSYGLQRNKCFMQNYLKNVQAQEIWRLLDTFGALRIDEVSTPACTIIIDYNYQEMIMEFWSSCFIFRWKLYTCILYRPSSCVRMVCWNSLSWRAWVRFQYITSLAFALFTRRFFHWPRPCQCVDRNWSRNSPLRSTPRL